MTQGAPLSAAAHLERLVGFKTISSASNLDLLDWVEDYLTPHQARFRRFPNEAGDKANLLVSIGPDEPGGIVLSGHTDVVPVDGQDWLDDPFRLRARDGRLIGRGAVDMKGFIACCLAVAPDLAAMKLRRPVHLALSYDEEVGCTGVGPMATWIGHSEARPSFAIIGEPSRMRLINAHKGGLIGWAHVTGKAGHSSQPDRYVNAVMVAAELISCINRIRADMRAGSQIEGFDPPYSTIQVNQIVGGSHGNIVAESCRFFWEMRVVPGVDDRAIFQQIERYAREVLEPEMKKVDPACGIRFDIVARIPALAPSHAELEAEILAVLGDTVPQAVPYGSEAGIFQNAGVRAVVCGPGDIAQAHQPEEYIEETELARCGDFLLRLCRSAASREDSAPSPIS
jgi:acetylornithine deacetylase